MKNIFRIAIALGVALVIASCEGTGKQKEVEKTADNNSVEAVADSSKDAEKGTLETNKVTFPVEEGKAWLFKHVTESLKKNVDKSIQSRTVKRMDVNFNKESAGTGVYLVSGVLCKREQTSILSQATLQSISLSSAYTCF